MSTESPQQAAPACVDASSFEDLTTRYRKEFNVAGSMFEWVRVADPNAQPVLVRRRTWTGRRTTRRKRPEVSMTHAMRGAYQRLVRCQERLPALSLPSSSPLPDQLDAAMVQLFAWANVVVDQAIKTGKDAYDCHYLLEHDKALDLAAQVAALVELASRREQVLFAIDPATLQRTADALTADLAAARAALGEDPLDRELARAAAR